MNTWDMASDGDMMVLSPGLSKQQEIVIRTCVLLLDVWMYIRLERGLSSQAVIHVRS